MNRKLTLIRRWLIVFMGGLLLSGLSAIPLEPEIAFLIRFFPANTGIGKWLLDVYSGLVNTDRNYPFMAYGFDWLAFAHFMIALLFLGPYRDPVRNKWVIEFGMIACVLILPYAFIAGQFRGIPAGWRLIDCSFGIIGLLPLIICRRLTGLLEQQDEMTVAGEAV